MRTSKLPRCGLRQAGNTYPCDKPVGHAGPCNGNGGTDTCDLADPLTWPLHPLLPVKHRHTLDHMSFGRLGVVFATPQDETDPVVYLCLLDDLFGRTMAEIIADQRIPRLRYADVAAMAAEWEVD